MDAGIILRVVLILTGIFLFGLTLSSLAKRKMTESFVLTWGLVSLIFVFAGIFLQPMEINRYISSVGLFLLGIFGFCMVFGAYFISIRISELIRKNLEMAMQISLMKKELEELKHILVRDEQEREEKETDQ